MRIYMLNAPYIDNFVRCGRWQGVAARGGTLYFPIWLAYAAGVLEKEGHKVKLVDAIAWKWDKNKVLEDAKKIKPDLVVVDSNFSSLRNDINVAKMLKEGTGAVSVLVGPPTSQFPDKILNDGIDIVARFEYDFTLKDLAEVIENGKIENVMGISYKENGKIIHNKNKFTSSEDLDEIPFVSEVYKEHLNIRDYFLNHALHPMVQIFTGRGCPNQCTFCSWPETLMGRKYRVRSVDNVVDEFEYVANELPGVKEIFIEDDTFTLNKRRIRQFCEELKRRKMVISWGCQSRADLDYDTMKVMKEAGCRLLDVGYESGNDAILRNIKKGITVNQLREFTKNAKKAKIKILADFVMGFSGETKETAEQTIRFIKEVKPDLLQVAVATPIPGTMFYDYVKENGYLLVDDLEESLDEKGFQKCIVSYPVFTKDDIENYVDRALKEYYLSPSFIPIAMRNVLRKNGLHELKVMVMSAKGFMKYMRRRR
jgi:anaerobic magnesium-protoporphyrin IX monomethyl ester cyclase